MGFRRDHRPGIEAIFADIADSCRRLESPTYAAWADCVVAWHDEEPLRSLLAPYADARIGDMVPLRLFAAVQRLALERRAPHLALYLPALGGGGSTEESMCRVLLSTIDEHRDEIAAALEHVPQTNEVGRTVGLAALLRRIHRAFGLPVDLHEIGCSAGLSLRVDALIERGVIAADHPDWGAMPSIGARRGCDLAPVDASTTVGRTLLTSFVWPDHVGRFERLRQALDVAAGVDADLVTQDALAYVHDLELHPGHAVVVWHSAMWLYLPADERRAIGEAIARLGESATVDSPLAHIGLEPVSRERGGQHRFTLTMSTWPGIGGIPPGIEVPWGYAPPAGEPVTWSVPCAGAIVHDGAGRILLVRRGRAPSRGMWSLPGGRVEGVEDWDAAAVREVREETAIEGREPQFVGIVERSSESGSTYVIADYAMTGSGIPIAGDDADDAQWCHAGDMASLSTSPGLVEALREWDQMPRI